MMNIIRGLLLGLLTLTLSGCGTLSGNLWPTVPKGLDAVRQTSGNIEACDTFEYRYGDDSSTLARFVSTLVSGEWQPPASSAVSVDPTPRLDPDEEKPGYLTHERVRAHFDNFLDCYFIDLVPYEEGKTDDQKRQLMALRGHAIVTVLARYAAYNLTGRIGGGLHTTAFPPYEDSPGDAGNVLARIEYAQRLIRKDAPEELRFPEEGKPQVQLTDESLYGYPNVQRVNRIFSVVQLAFEAERPTLRRAQGIVSEIIGLFPGANVTAFRNLVEYAVAGLEKAALLGTYSRAYRSSTKMIFDGIQGTPGKEDWEKVDGALQDACLHLATIANGAVPHCLPFKEKK